MADAKRDSNMVVTLIAVSNADGITPVVLWADPVTHRLLTSTTGATLTVLAATGTINSLNAAFTFTSKPTYIVSDGVWLRENGGWTWNSGSLTATMSVPPTFDIYGF